MEAGAGTPIRKVFQRATVRCDYIVTHSQAKTCPAILGAEEGFKDVWLLLQGNARAIVMKEQLHPIGGGLCCDL